MINIALWTEGPTVATVLTWVMALIAFLWVKYSTSHKTKTSKKK